MEIEVANNSVQKIVSLSQPVWTQVFLVKEVLLTRTAVTFTHINQINLSLRNNFNYNISFSVLMLQKNAWYLLNYIYD